jgi:hypothetical protein
VESLRGIEGEEGIFKCCFEAKKSTKTERTLEDGHLGVALVVVAAVVMLFVALLAAAVVDILTN